MKKIALTLLALSVVYAGNAFAEAKLLVENYVKVTAINGKEVRHNALQPLKREFNLEAGRHVITARYDRLFDLTRGDHDYLKSANVTVTADLADNQTYQLTMPNQPTHYQDAKEYIKSPTLAVSQNGQIIAQESVTVQREGILSSLGNMFGRNDAINANQQAIASLNQNQTPATNAPTTTAGAGVSSSTSAQANKDNLDGFMQLWLNSSEEEREKIRQWVEK
mgnify:CR=1 FL=1